MLNNIYLEESPFWAIIYIGNRELIQGNIWQVGYVKMLEVSPQAVDWQKYENSYGTGNWKYS